MSKSYESCANKHTVASYHYWSFSNSVIQECAHQLPKSWNAITEFLERRTLFPPLLLDLAAQAEREGGLAAEDATAEAVAVRKVG